MESTACTNGGPSRPWLVPWRRAGAFAYALRSPPPTNVTTLFRAAQQAAVRLEEEIWDNEGGHVMASGWRVVRSPAAEMPYTVILTHEDSEPTEHSFETMREAEDFIRRNTTAPSRGLSALFHRPPAVFSATVR